MNWKEVALKGFGVFLAALAAAATYDWAKAKFYEWQKARIEKTNQLISKTAKETAAEISKVLATYLKRE